MRFTWREDKAAINLRKHGISFEIAITAWADPMNRIDEDAEAEGDEPRWHLTGLDASGRLLLVVHIEVDPTTPVIHVISARKADAYEKYRYESREL